MLGAKLMKNLTGNEIRQRFLEFFAERGHLVLPSASLIPQDDPTLLLIGAGMAPFKPFFTGKMKPPSPRITTCQKCVRTGDIENVGRTARHHTYFEMLGDFSFGDYFKKEIIPWSWEFLTKELEIPADKLWITVHTKDDEAFAIWHDVVGVPAERIVRLEENFWEIGSGPCGPCSEIHIDLGEERGCGKPTCGVGCDCDRFLELWNLVFTQYNQNEDGTYTPLANKNIDTGAGLERIASVLQRKPSNFETDLIFPIIEYTSKIANVQYGVNKKNDISLKVVADHVRSMTFMICDGILPSNEGRGYVLRRILRRAIRHGRLLGINNMFLNGAVEVVIAMYGGHYKDLLEKKVYIQKVVEMEEARFLQTLQQGTEILNAEMAKMQEESNSKLNGETVFKLYDTFGFPWELTSEILEEHGLPMDKLGFDKAMEEQKNRARTARNDKEGRPVIYNTRGIDVGMLKVDEESANGKILAIYPIGVAQPIDSASDGTTVAIVLDNTAFHAEGGGQVGDIGSLLAPTGILNVENTKKLPDGVTIHVGTVTEGSLTVGEEVNFDLDIARKNDVARNHTATHLLQAALKQVLGDHVNQAGSYVGPDRLRFDFSHFSPVTAEELKKVETIVNDKILAAIDVKIMETEIEKAKAMGATALFGEKYGKMVRVVTVPGFSMEFCGGVHVHNTANIGMFKILSEASTGAGVRRIEAVTGHGALSYVREAEGSLKEISLMLKARPAEIVTRLSGVQEELKAAEHKISELENKIASAQVGDIASQIRTIKGIKILVQIVSVNDMEALRSLGDQMRDKVDGVVVLASKLSDGKISVLAMATKTAIAAGVNSGIVVKEVAKIMGGGGGGRPDMAQAGGKNAAKMEEAMEKAWLIVEGLIK